VPAMSIVIPTFNSERVLPACLKAIRESSFTDYEIIVVDGQSQDSTREVAGRFADRVIHQVPNLGRSHARNLGVEASTGAVLVFIDSDNVLMPDSLGKIAQWFHDHEGTHAVTGLISQSHPNPDFFSQYKNLYMNYIFGLLPDQVTFLHGSLYAVRRESITVGDTEFTTDDTERGQHMFAQGKRIDFIRDLEVVHLKRYTFGSLMKNDFTIPFEWAKIFAKHRGWRQLGRNRTGFAHSPKEQLLSVMLVPAIVACAGAAMVNPSLFMISLLLLIIAWTALNCHFVAFLGRKRGVGFALFSWPLTFLDHFTMAGGIICGLAVSLGSGRGDGNTDNAPHPSSA